MAVRRIIAAVLLTSVFSMICPAFADQEISLAPLGRTTVNFDAGWRFYQGDAADVHQPAFDDRAWRTLDVPHDWSIEGKIDQQNRTGPGGAFMPSGVGWYRKSFTLPSAASSKSVYIEFDGVMANSEVWINGTSLGKRPNGYVSFRYELTPHLKFGDGATNLIAVKADTSGQPASRWYTGAGIYRHVRIVVTDRLQVAQWGTFVRTPQVTKDQSEVIIGCRVDNRANDIKTATVRVRIQSQDGKEVASAAMPSQAIEPGKSFDFVQSTLVPNMAMWDLDHPTMYRAEVTVVTDNTVVDSEVVPFGAREFKFVPETGFWLNGQNFKLKGVCLHHDGGAVGAAVPMGIWERRLTSLREMGVNAIRTAHNPPDPAFLDLCDRMGFVVMDELFDCWRSGKNTYDYHLNFDEWSVRDVQDTVRRDRNHPSVILYSAGNEIHDTPKQEIAKEILGKLVAAFHENDPTRPVTQALFRPNVSRDYDNGLADMLDVVGQNYRENELMAAWRQKPTRKIIGTENVHTRQVWAALRDNPQMAGQFIWTGVDYLGEGYRWPAISTAFGMLDRTGFRRPGGYERQSWWSNAPMIHATRRTGPGMLPPTDPGYEPANTRRPTVQFSDWTPRNAAPHEETVEVYSNCDRVELFLNDKSLGTKDRSKDDAPRVWKVAYESGTLRAVGMSGGKPVATHELKTAGPPVAIRLTSDRKQIGTGFDDVVLIEAAVVDAAGVVVPSASELIQFNITGAGKIIAVDNGNTNAHEPFNATQRTTFQGRCIAIVKAMAGDGTIGITATSKNLTARAATVDVVKQSE